jgi:hypothetical protein
MKKISRTDRPRSCRRCRQVKPATEFWPNERVSTGLSPWCKDCHRAATRRSREKYRARYAAARRKPEATRACEECGGRFTTAIPHKRFCSERCRKRAERHRLRGRETAVR